MNNLESSIRFVCGWVSGSNTEPLQWGGWQTGNYRNVIPVSRTRRNFI